MIFNVEATLKVDSTFIMKNIYKHIFWWFAFQFIAIFNAALREFIYKKPHIFYIIIKKQKS